MVAQRNQIDEILNWMIRLLPEELCARCNHFAAHFMYADNESYDDACVRAMLEVLRIFEKGRNSDFIDHSKHEIFRVLEYRRPPQTMFHLIIFKVVRFPLPPKDAAK